MSKAKKSPLNLTPGFPIQFYPEQPAMLDRIAKKKRQSKGKTVRDAVAFALANGFGETDAQALAGKEFQGVGFPMSLHTLRRQGGKPRDQDRDGREVAGRARFLRPADLRIARGILPRA